MDKEVVQLRDDGWRDVSRTLTGDRYENAELAALLDDFLEKLEAIVLPALTFPC
ncbi:hypothetical protein D3C72_2234580 [compost metagenome]